MSTTSGQTAELLSAKPIDKLEKYFKYFDEIFVKHLDEFRKRSSHEDISDSKLSAENLNKNFDFINIFETMNTSIAKIKEEIGFRETQQQLNLTYDESKKKPVLSTNLNEKLSKITDIITAADIEIDKFINKKLVASNATFYMLKEKFDAERNEIKSRNGSEKDILQLENKFKKDCQKECEGENGAVQFNLLSNPAINKNDNFMYRFSDCKLFYNGFFTPNNKDSSLPSYITPQSLNQFLQNEKTDDLVSEEIQQRPDKF